MRPVNKVVGGERESLSRRKGVKDEGKGEKRGMIEVGSWAVIKRVEGVKLGEF